MTARTRRSGRPAWPGLLSREVRWTLQLPGGLAPAVPAVAYVGSAARPVDAGAVIQAGPAHWPPQLHPVNARPNLATTPRQRARNSKARAPDSSTWRVIDVPGATGVARS